MVNGRHTFSKPESFQHAGRFRREADRATEERYPEVGHRVCLFRRIEVRIELAIQIEVSGAGIE